MTEASNLNWSQEERLYLLIEECGEVIQAATKVLRHGYNSGHPAKPGSSNRNDLEHELGDLQFAVALLVEKQDIMESNINYFSNLAVKNKPQYLHHNNIPKSWLQEIGDES